MPPSPAPDTVVVVHPSPRLADRLPALTEFVRRSAPVVPLSQHPGWLTVLRDGLGHQPFVVEVVTGGRLRGFLPLAFVSGPVFGRFLVSLPYLNTNGVVAESDDVRRELVSRAVALADDLDARSLELRHEQPVEHPALNASLTSKVHMRLPLPKTADALWKAFDPKVRNQVRKPEKHGFAVEWGAADLLPDFYAVVCRNMRDLGTPVYGLSLFRAILATFADQAELCVVRDGSRPVAAALLLHGWGVTEVPTASSLREYNPSAVNMLMYWKLLERSVARGQRVFDFGRSTLDGSTFKFKKQWGAVPHPAAWQYHLRGATATEMRPDNPKYQLAIRVWQRLPVAVTKVIGPAVVRGIP